VTITTMELLGARYVSALEEYLGGAGESALAQAYEIGRAGIDERLGLLDLVSIHRESVANVSRGLSKGDAARAADVAMTFLVESLAAYEMAQEGYRVTSARLLETKEELERGAAALVQSNESLQSEIRQRAEAEQGARTAQAEAERANRSKSDFLSRMSHELRTPLNSILGFGQVLEMGDLSAEDHESVSQILAGGKHLLGLIDEILDISRIETGRMALSVEPVELREVVAQAVEMVSPIAAARQVTVRVEDPDGGGTHVSGDRQRLTQALLNLLSNAVKYNVEGGTVAVSWSQQPESLVVRVRDTGIGIAPEKVARAFEPFDRLGAEETGIEGTGLGLAVSKRLLEAMGGDLRVEETALGSGTTFALELPRAEDPVEQYDRTHDEMRTVSTAVGVLVYVEDNLANLRLIERVLHHRPGVELVTAKTGRAGLEVIRDRTPDLVLLDLHLPDLAGPEILDALKHDPATSGIPVVVLSADAMTEQRRKILEAGAREYLTKPVEVAQLLEVVDAVLGEAR